MNWAENFPLPLFSTCISTCCLLMSFFPVKESDFHFKDWVYNYFRSLTWQFWQSFVYISRCCLIIPSILLCLKCLWLQEPCNGSPTLSVIFISNSGWFQSLNSWYTYNGLCMLIVKSSPIPLLSMNRFAAWMIRTIRPPPKSLTFEIDPYFVFFGIDTFH